MALEEYYKQLYKTHLLPSLGRVMNSELSIGERCRAIKYLADESLALTASGEDWSQALVQKLLQQQHQDAAATTAETLTSASISPPKPSANSLRLRRIAARASFCRRFDRTLRLRASSSSSSSSSSWGVRRRLQRPSTAAVMRRARRLKHIAKQSRISAIISSSRPRAIRSRVQELQSLVPGGTQMNCDVLLDQAADYMMFLKFQVGVLQSLLGEDAYQHQRYREQ